MKDTKRRVKNWFAAALVLMAAAFACSCGYFADSGAADDVLTVHFIDVGQGDCELIQYGETGILIDAGENGNGAKVSAYIKNAGVTRLEYVVATHPHSDHIGGLPTVIKDNAVEHIVMPDVTHTTASFERLLEAIDAKGLRIEVPTAGDVLETGISGLTLTVLAPVGSGYGDMNDYSVAVRAEYGAAAFLFMGDATALSEKEILASGADVSADVIKIGHHGSHGSSSEKFLEAVAPGIAVISCGAGNSYGHPHRETLSKLADLSVKVYRTDTDGTVKMTTDGAKIDVTAERNGE